MINLDHQTLDTDQVGNHFTARQTAVEAASNTNSAALSSFRNKAAKHRLLANKLVDSPLPSTKRAVPAVCARTQSTAAPLLPRHSPWAEPSCQTHAQPSLPCCVSVFQSSLNLFARQERKIQTSFLALSANFQRDWNIPGEPNHMFSAGEKLWTQSKYHYRNSST